VTSSPFQYIGLDFSKAEYKLKPYPYFVFKQVFSEETIQSLKQQFPAALLSERSVVAGGRRQLTNTSPEFYKFLAQSPCWGRVYREFNSEQFVNAVMASFQSEILRYQPLFELEKLEFDPKLFERQSNLRSVKYYQALSHTKLLALSSKQICKYLAVREYLRWRSKYEKLLNTGQFKVALSFDLSIAHEGYSREIHRDSDGRIAAMVVYLDDFNTGDGGSFIIHEHKIRRQMEEYEPQPAMDQALPVAEYNPRANLGLLFLNVPNAYHSVPVISKSGFLRKFFYLGITLVGKKAWKNRFHFDYNQYLA